MAETAIKSDRAADASVRGGASSGSVPQEQDRIARSFVAIAVTGIGLYYLTSLVVIMGAVFGMEYVHLCTDHPDSTGVVPETIAGHFAPWDGVWYRRIALDGYSYDPERMSNVAFYPLYPLAAGVLARVTGLHVDWALLLTSHLFLAGAFILMAAYLREREQPLSVEVQDCVLLALGLFPTTFYFRMSYTESCFLFTLLLAMYGMQRRWPTVLIALAVGLATAARPMGIALLPPFAWYLWKGARNKAEFAVGSGVFMPLACWGLAAFMAYQWYAFDEPLAFARTQVHWYERMPPVDLGARIMAHLMLEPLWRVYDPSSACYWGRDAPRDVPLLSMQFMNPIFVLLTWAMIAYGAIRRRLSAPEVLLSVGLLLIPYVTHAYRSCMSSEARYASVAFPFYIVVGGLLARCPDVIAHSCYAVSAAFLGLYAAMFVSWYWFY